jgi:hypothetical protein
MAESLAHYYRQAKAPPSKRALLTAESGNSYRVCSAPIPIA